MPTAASHTFDSYYLNKMDMKRTVSLLLLVLLLISNLNSAFAESSIDLASYVTPEMCSSSYWKEAALHDSSQLLLTVEEIKRYNQEAINSPDAYVFDLLALGQQDYDVTDAGRAARAKDADTPLRPLYSNGERINNRSYFGAIRQAILDTGYSGTSRRSELAVATKYTALLAIPTLDIIGYRAEDPDHEYQNSALVVNEPFVIRQTALVRGTRFYFGYTTNMSGWVRAEDLALFGTYESWLNENGVLDEARFQQDFSAWANAWNFDPNGKDFLVVNQDKIILESSYTTPATSDVRLTLSTALRLVPANEKPQALGERGTWNNYVVYLPTRDENGQYRATMALIPQHYRVSIGYLPYTQSNLLDLAFSCLGNRYGWSGMLNAYDCSLYVRTVYRCFGFEMPRNTTNQQKVHSSDVLKTVDLSGMTDEQKSLYLAALPVGSMLYLHGHTLLYVGTVNGQSYGISALGSVMDANGEAGIKTEYCVALTPLSCRRKNGNTWLHELTTAVVVRNADCQ